MMTNGQAMMIFENINSDAYTINEKGLAIHQILSMATLNGVSKDKIQRAFIWLWHQHFEMNDPVDLLTEDEE
jgi:hypothetical protein